MNAATLQAEQEAMRQRIKPASKPKHMLTGRLPGTPKTGGRKKGTPNKCRKSIDYFAERVFKETDMVAKGIELLSHKDPRVQAMVWCRLMDYKFGRPREQIVVSGSVSMKSIIEQARERVAGKIISIASDNSDNSLNGLQLSESAESAQILESSKSNESAGDLLESTS